MGKAVKAYLKQHCSIGITAQALALYESYVTNEDSPIGFYRAVSIIENACNLVRVLKRANITEDFITVAINSDVRTVTALNMDGMAGVERPQQSIRYQPPQPKGTMTIFQLRKAIKDNLVGEEVTFSPALAALLKSAAQTAPTARKLIQATGMSEREILDTVQAYIDQRDQALVYLQDLHGNSIDDLVSQEEGLLAKKRQAAERIIALSKLEAPVRAKAPRKKRA